MVGPPQPARPGILRRVVSVVAGWVAWWWRPTPHPADRWAQRLRVIRARYDADDAADAEWARDAHAADVARLLELEDFDRRLGVVRGLSATTTPGPDTFDRAGVAPAHDRPATVQREPRPPRVPGPGRVVRR